MLTPDKKNIPLSRRRFLGRLVGTGFLGLGAVAVDQRGEADALTVARVDVPLAAWPKGTPALRVGLLADMHCDSPHSLVRARHAAALLLAEQPDVVFLGGDYITVRPSRWAVPAAEALTPLVSVPGGVYCVLGNHDWTNYRWFAAGADEVARALTAVGFTVLRNAAAPLPTSPGVWVVGLDDLYARQQNPTQALQGVPADACKILLVHEPDFADLSPPGFALQLSGHSHGGQIRLPGLPPLHVPQYATHYPEGLRQGPRHLVYTTRGVGTTGPPVRLFCPPEVTLLHLHSL